MESGSEPQQETQINFEEILDSNLNSNPKIVVIMGATGSGKSKLAIDLASHFPIEIINADSMQVYNGLDVLTNKVPLQDQKGVPHHLLGTVSPNVEFTAKDFRDAAVPLINEIWSRKRLPVIVGGTNYYIQALVSPFLLDDSLEETKENCLLGYPGDDEPDSALELEGERSYYTYDHLKELDPTAASRIHPNDQRKISYYLSLHARFGVLPSKFLQEKTVENWGRIDNSRFHCCFICVDASLPALDQYVGQRVDCMVDSGLLDEVVDIYKPDADYTKGIRQAIGVREFADFLRCFSCEPQNSSSSSCSLFSADKTLKELHRILGFSDANKQKLLLTEAIEEVKLNTRRLVRRQKRRIKRLQTLFGWNIDYVDSTEAILHFSDEIWAEQVVEPSAKIIKASLDEKACSEEPCDDSEEMKLIQRDLWTQYVCEACGNRVLRGAHEWEQHKQGRSHCKRISRLKKSGSLFQKG
ncbi:hypothetical protein M9H77_16432 [Catharanthus roseus]|uniref:Uncharacterized protein n=1 Tax=Catharanthus roseus TaxID=4058 RepID=A0ACC0B1R3_CATRO|nr:hypothetical protein M9H77_16432 [Catharanthus roseus]